MIQNGSLVVSWAPTPTVWIWPTQAPHRAERYVRYRGRIQPVNATRSLNISAGVWKPRVLRGLWFNCLAIALS